MLASARQRRLAAVVLAASTLGFAPEGRADLPPPDGTKFVSYAFTVDAVPKDFVLLAYPCSGSSGVPVVDVAMVEGGKPVAVGRRGGNCKLYGMARADFEAFQKARKPSDHGADVKSLDALFAGPKVMPCDGGPTLAFTLPSSDPRSEIVEALAVRKLDATGCVVRAAASVVPAPSAAPSSTTTPEAPPTSLPTAPLPTAPPPSDPQAPLAQPPGARGCGGCAVSSSEAGLSVFVAVGLVALASTRRKGRARP
jgi:hypothetical protein